MEKSKASIAAAVLIGTLALHVQAQAEDFKYRYAEAGLQYVDSFYDGKGGVVAASTRLPRLGNTIVFGGASYLEYGHGDSLLNLEAGLGFHWPLLSVVDVTGGAALEHNSFRGDAGDSATGYGVNAGVRAVPLTPRWELDAGLKYVDIGSFDDTSVLLGTRYALTPHLRAGLQLASGEEDYWTLSLRWEP